MVAIGDVPIFAANTNSPTVFVAFDLIPGVGLEFMGVALELRGSGANLGDHYTQLAKATLIGMRRRHLGRWNVVFCDGHVENLRTSDLLDGRWSEVLKRWNRDGLPHPENTPPLLR
jgi:prepilin-type processing-associated H-X9-DG protein